MASGEYEMGWEGLAVSAVNCKDFWFLMFKGIIVENNKGSSHCVQTVPYQ